MNFVNSAYSENNYWQQYPIDNSNPNSEKKVQAISHKHKKTKPGFKKKNKKLDINSSSQAKIN